MDKNNCFCNLYWQDNGDMTGSEWEGVMKGPWGGIFDLGTPELQLRHMSTRCPQGYIRKIEILKWLYSVFYQIKSVTGTSFLYVCIV